MRTLWQDLRFSVRLLMKSPGFSAVALITLALGIGANSAMFSFVDTVLLRALPYPTAPRVVDVFERRVRENVPRVSVSPGDFYEWRSKSHSFEQFAAIDETTFDLTGLGEPQRLDGADVAPGFFEALGIRPAAGRFFVRSEEERAASYVIVISDGFWRRMFGSDPAAVGRTLQLNGTPFTIVGMLPSGFRYPFGGQLDIYRPLAFSPKLHDEHGAHFLRVIGLLRPGSSVEQAQAEMDVIAKQMESEYAVNQGHGVSLVPLHEVLTGNVRPALLILLGAVGLVLLIACANVANLLLARGKSREREFAVRAALGSGRARIIRQLLTESALLGILGGGLAVLVSQWTVGGLRVLFFSRLHPFLMAGLDRAGVDGRVLVFTFVISMVTACLFGMAPALASTRLNLAEALKEGSRGSSRGDRRGFRSALVIVEVALSVVLLAGAGLLLRSFGKLITEDLGYRADHLLTMDLSLSPKKYDTHEKANAFYGQLLERIGATPGVRSAALADIFPLTDNDGRETMHLEGQIPTPTDTTRLHPRLVTAGYLETMGIRVLRGRGITAGDIAGRVKVGVISESAVRAYWPNVDPLGRRFTFEDTDKNWVTIVGVAADVRHRNLDEAPTPDVYMAILQDTHGEPDNDFTVAARTSNDPLTLGPALRREVAALDPSLPVAALHTMDELVSDSVAPERFNLTLLGIFAALALVLAAAGLYGVISFTVGQRTHEIGIRMALGAQRRDVLAMVIGQGMRLIFAGIAVGLLAALLLTRLLQSLLFGVSSGDPLTFVSVVALLILVAVAACYIPARRATQIDPICALRYE